MKGERIAEVVCQECKRPTAANISRCINCGADMVQQKDYREKLNRFK